MTVSRLVVLLAASALLAACDRASPPAPPVDGTPAVPPGGAIAEKKDVFTVVMVGDSLTAGFGLAAADALPVRLEAALRAEGRNVAIVNAGVSGDTTKDALGRFDWAISDKPNAVLIALGGNDLLRGVAPAETEKNLRAMIEAAKEKGVKVALAGMKAPGNYGAEYRAAFNAIYPRLAAAYEIPLYPFLLDGVATDAALNQKDGIHPNPKGVATIVSRLAPFVAALSTP